MRIFSFAKLIINVPITTSAKQTKEIAKKFASKLRGGDIILLHGELGSGKTTFVKGLSEGLGIKEDITSPTFTLMNIYNVNTSTHQHINTFAHIDTYRLGGKQELVEIGVEDYIGDENTVCAIEWPEKVALLVKGKKTKKVHFQHINKNTRKILFDN